MLSEFGQLSIFLVIIFSILIIYKSFLSLKSNNQIIEPGIYQLSLWQVTVTILSFLVLIASYIVSDFSLINVYENSHTTKPLFYKIAGSWGNHEGSLLLWINILVIFSYLFLIFNFKHLKNFRLLTLVIQNLIILGFTLFLIFNSNPFSKLEPAPLEGLGLNPILQDPALALHPPMLYVGFVGCSIYFSAAIASMLSNYRGKLFAKSIKSWVLISWCFQTLGISLGSIWAYYELGWGGFWFWDPVENASLLPWFAITALMHSVMVLEKRENLYAWVIILCLITFILSVTGTFLVRSGILNSVHTFASDPARGIYILLFLSVMIFSSLIIFFRTFKKESYNFYFKSKETFILINNWFMAFFLVTVLVGTLYPIFLDVVTNEKISVGPPFYNIVIIPLTVPLLILMVVGPQLSWINSKSLGIIKHKALIIIGALLVNLIIYLFFGSSSFLSNLIFISALFLIIHSIMEAYKIYKKKIKFELPRVISHLGFGLLVLFIGINHNFSNEQDFNLKVGEEKKFNEYSIIFKDLKLKQEKNYKALIGNFEIKNFDKKINKILNPEIRIYSNPETLTYEAAIKTRIDSDLYLTMSNISRSDYYNIKFQHKPLMIWIWISVLMIVLGGFLQLMRNKNES